MIHRYLTLAVITLLLAALVCGCEGQSSYKVLSFFFDGVPNPEEVKSEGDKEQKKGEAQPKTTYKKHGPYEAKQCDSCHQRGSNNLVAPIEKLCFRCHAVDISKKYIHGPLASGGCKICHEPHGSRYPSLLVAEPREFCFFCHRKDDLDKSETHKGTVAQCTTCHDAHSSDKEFLLR